MQYVLLAVLIVFLITDLGLAAFFGWQADAALKKSAAWWGHVLIAAVLTANALVFLILFATKSLQIWD